MAEPAVVNASPLIYLARAGVSTCCRWPVQRYWFRMPSPVRSDGAGSTRPLSPWIEPLGYRRSLTRPSRR